MIDFEPNGHAPCCLEPRATPGPAPTAAPFALMSRGVQV
jgi:hypothetical protein